MHAAYKLYVTDDALSSGTERVRNCSWSKEHVDTNCSPLKQLTSRCSKNKQEGPKDLGRSPEKKVTVEPFTEDH